MRNSFKHSATALHAGCSASSPVPAVSLAAVSQWTSRLKVIWRLCLCSSAAVVLLGDVSAADAQPADSKGEAVAAHRIGDFVAGPSRRFSIPPSWIRAVMRVESRGDPRALSPKGAMGLMQIMPDTWSELRSSYGFGADPYDPHANIVAGAAYLRESCTIALAIVGSLRPTMQAGVVTRTISQPVDRCRQRRCSTWQLSVR